MDPNVRPIDEVRRRAFERGRAQSEIEISEYLPPPDDERYLATLEELVAIDLEFTWRLVGDRARVPRMESYLARFPELDTAEIRRRLAEEERVLRSRFGGGRRELEPRPRVEHPGAEDVPAIGRYRLIEEAGRGSFALVYRAFDPTLDREVALKLLRREFAGHVSIRARMEREARSAARMHHPGIVPIYEVGEAAGRPYLVTEFIEGRTLEEVLRDEELTPESVALLVARVADALHYAHQVGIVHRDVKPANVLLTLDGTPKLADFGLAVATEIESDLTQDGDLLGTPAYMAPEQISDPEHADARSDVYSLGVLLFRALAGRLPFEGSWASILQEKQSSESPRLSGVRADLPHGLDVICATAMARDRERRYTSAAELAADLRHWLAKEPVLARSIGAFERMELWARRNPKVVVTAAIGALLAGFIGLAGASAVLDERDRFRTERDAAQANLYRSLIGEARARLDLRDSGWWWAGMKKLVDASKLETVAHDEKELTELAISFLGAKDPCFRLLHERADHEGDVRAVAVDATGQLVASGGVDGQLVVRRVDSGDELYRQGLRAEVAAVRFVRRDVVAGTSAGELLRFAASGVELERIQCLNGGVTAIAGRFERPKLVIGGYDGSLRVFDEASADLGPEFGSGAAIVDIDLSPSGELIGVARDDQTLEAWNLSTMELVGRTRTMDSIAAVAFRSEHVLVSVEPAMFGAKLYDVTRLDERRGKAFTVESQLRDVASANGWIVSAEHNGDLHAVDPRLATRAVGRRDFKIAWSVALDERGLVTAAGHSGGVVRVWELTQPSGRWFLNDSHFVEFTRSGEVQVDGVRYSLHAGGALEGRPYRPVKNERIARHPSGFVAGSEDGRLALYDETWSVLSATETHRERIVELTVDVARGTIASADSSGAVWIHGPKLERPIPVPVSGTTVRGLGFFEDGRIFVLTELGARVVASNGAVLQDVKSLRATCGITVGDDLVVGTSSGVLERWALVEGEWQLQRALRGTGVGHLALAYAPGARRLVVESEDRSLTVWDLSADRLELRIAERVEARGPARLAIDDQGRWILHHGTSTVWDLATKQPFLWLETSNVGSSVFGADDSLFTLGAAGAVLRVDVGGFAREQALLKPHERAWPLRVRHWEQVLGGGHSSKVWGHATSMDQSVSASCAHDGSVKLWRNFDQPELIWTRDEGRGDIAWAVAFHPNGKLLASTSLDVSVWDVSTGERLLRLDAHDRLVTGVAFFHARPWLATCSFDGSVLVWNWQTGELVGELLRSSGAVHGLAFDQSGRWLAAACRDGSIRLWDFEAVGTARGAGLEDAIASELRPASTSPIWAVAFDQAGERLASADEAGDVTLWSIPGLVNLVTLRSDAVRLRDLAFSADGTKLGAGCFADDVIVWDLEGVRKTLRGLDLAGW